MKEEIITVSSKGQIVLPSDIRERLGIGKGRKLVVAENEGVVILKPIKKLSELRGILKIKGSTKKIIRDLRKEWDIELE